MHGQFKNILNKITNQRPPLTHLYSHKPISQITADLIQLTIEINHYNLYFYQFIIITALVYFHEIVVIMSKFTLEGFRKPVPTLGHKSDDFASNILPCFSLKLLLQVSSSFSSWFYFLFILNYVFYLIYGENVYTLGLEPLS